MGRGSDWGTERAIGPPPGDGRRPSPPSPLLGEGLRHHSGAMRSGPSALITRRVTCRQVKRAGGPSGISASTVKGSGRVNRSCGRLGLGEDSSGQKDGPAKALLRPCANSGMWLPIGKRRRTARAPKRLIRRSINGSAAAFPFPCVSEVCAGEKRLGHERGKRHEIDAEAHVERLDLVLDEAQKMLGLARGAAQACLDHGR